MTQTAISGNYYNANLFSNYYLDERIYGLDEWDCDDTAREAMEELQDLYERERDQFAGRKEDQHISRWIEPVLETLGFAHASEATLPSGGGYVDRTLFGSDDELLAAENGDSETFFARSLALLEAKQWGHDFEAEFGTDRQYRNASHQIKHYLEQTPDEVGWGVLTDGKKWRLYGTKEYEARTYYEVDLPELLERGNLEAFKRFFVFFRAEAFRAVGETTFLDRVWAESETAAQELGEDLQDNVFTALRVLGEGFVESNDLDIDPGDEEALAELKEQSLVLLYRLMFVSYAESRDLIHPEGEERAEYEENFSFGHLRETVKETVDSGETFASGFSTYSDSMWSRLSRLFDLVDSGEDALGIPAYNGGLFDPMKHAFLDEHSVYDRWLAEVVYLISTTDSETSDEVVFADYADLDTRHLGSIYEGLLEHEFRIAGEPLAAVADDGGQTWKPADEVTVADAVETVDPGELYVVNDDGERKATGAYYTPDYVVTYIVEETIDPLLDEIRADLNADGLESGDPQYYARFHRRVLDLTVLDPAMGSGHFLTKATEYLAEAVMEESRELASAGGIDEQAVRREISKECIYGVDLNGMAVELAKLSMWLETLATDQPLAFLDHHLKSGNSLVGSDIETIEGLESDASDDADTQSSLAEFGATRAGTIERLMDIYQEFLAIENEDIEDAREMERKYREIEQDDLRQRLVGMANVATAEDFGVDVPSGAYERMARSLEADDEWAEVEQQDWYQTGQSLAEEHDFFHWKLEFPEVFYDRDGGMAERSGYDAVVGNPPYVRIYGDRLPDEVVEYYRTAYESAYKKFDLYILFLDISLDLLHHEGFTSQIVPDKFLNTPYGEKLRDKIYQTSDIQSILDLRDTSVFKDASVSNVIPVFTKQRTANSKISIREKEHTTFPEVNRADINLLTTGTENTIRLRVEQGDISILDRISKKSIRFDDVYYVNWGLRTGTAEKTNKYVVKETDDPRAKPMIRGQDVAERYRLLPPSEYVIYAPEDFYNPMFPELFENPKLVFRKISGEGIMAVVDESGYYCFSTLIPCVNIREVSHIDRSGIPNETPESSEYDDPYFALAVVNSNLTAWYYHKTLSDELSVVPGHVSELPLPEVEFGTGRITEQELEQVHNQTISGKFQEIIDRVTPDGSNSVVSNETTYRVLSYSARKISKYQDAYVSLNLHLPDYLGSYNDGPTLADLSPMPPSGLADSVLTKGMGDVEQYETVRATEATVERTGNRVTVSLVPYVKPIESERDEYETNTHDYATLDPVPAMEFHDVDDDLAALLEAFVPYAVEEEKAGYRDGTTKTISLLDRLEDLTLPAIEDVRDGIERYEQATERAAELDEQIERTDDLIDELVYDLYGLTDEEIEIVEQAVGE
ncbi:Eco57I restriction-modification methylase domain-containing protein [Halosegnis rubeus]|uniref:site-specific DNA-methyltransferase (adenine-specific) n=1 Tax=Halosegnis rubeus TaxID=2212850 RepID=A0A5N5UDT7_9EURY|nr:TaqI-like C-terminal specificity domain-containing protein [Halosegnis rubeus]KAB7516787.1 N-6 DNA methylase [Halosegnis rubeus]